MLVTKENVKEIFKGYRVIFEEAFQGIRELTWRRIAMETQSSGDSEDYAFLSAIPGVRELIGEIQVKNLSTQKFTITNKEWEVTIGLPVKLVERDTYGLLKPQIQMMAQVTAQHPDDLVSDLLINGFTTKCYTGKNFFDTDHEPVKGGTKFTNKDTKKLSAGNWEAARAALRGIKNSEGRPMNLGRDLALCVSPENEGLAKRILEAEFQNGGDSNVNKGTGKVLVLPKLGGATHKEKWFVIEAGYPVRALIVQIERQPTALAVTDPEDSYVVLKKQFINQGYYRGNAGYGLPEFAWGSDGTTGP